MVGLLEESLALVRLSSIRSRYPDTNQGRAIVRGMILSPLNLGPWPYGTIHDPMPTGPLALVQTHFKAQPEPKYHNESILS